VRSNNCVKGCEGCDDELVGLKVGAGAGASNFKKVSCCGLRGAAYTGIASDTLTNNNKKMCVYFKKIK